MLDDVGVAVSVHSEDPFLLQECLPFISFLLFLLPIPDEDPSFDISVSLAATNAHSVSGCSRSCSCEIDDDVLCCFL
jgi:hypothetical protein